MTDVVPADLVPVAAARPAGPAVVAGELLVRARAELPALAGLGPREELLAAVWVMSLRSARTRRAYAGDLRALAGLARRSRYRRAGGRAGARGPVGDGPAGLRRGGLQHAAAPVGAVELLPVQRRP
ncbi:MAG TPA: hypothetical protein VMV92_29340 [Streptosporangiaceae bacterium]|nr:hypothetical protein [Streptosporangiaceae bacterium]